jgi:hypothetical protein
MGHSLNKGVKTNAVYGVLSTTAATVYSDQVDMSGYEGCRFVAIAKSTGASTGTAALTIVGTNTSTAASTGYVAISGASITVAKSTTASSQRIGTIDVLHPQKRYLKAKWVQLAKIALSGIVAEKYGPRVEPVAQSTYSASKFLASAVATSHVTTRMESTST